MRGSGGHPLRDWGWGVWNCGRVDQEGDNDWIIKKKSCFKKVDVEFISIRKEVLKY